jgi:staphylococcal nuclease domain-containing protein 1
MAFVKDLILQREVEIEVEAIDKGGNFIGWLTVDNKNVSVELVEEGFAAAYVMQERGNYGRQVQAAEDNAKRRKIKRWENFVEKAAEENDEEEANKKEEAGERKVNYEKVVVTEITAEGNVFAQHVDQGPKLEQLMKEIRQEFSTSPPLGGAYMPKRGDICAAKFDLDDQWYRAKVEKVTPNDCTVLYIDYGNRATISKNKTASLPSSFSALPGFAKEYHLALCQLAQDVRSL